MRDFRRQAVVHKPDVLSSLYYAHGLFCASYPITVVCFAGVVVTLCSLPYFITWTGGLNTPKLWRSSWLNYRVPTSDTPFSKGADWLIQDDHHFSKEVPSWFTDLPVAVIQQFHVGVAINCTKTSQLCAKSFYGTSRLVASYLLDQLQDAESICRPVMHEAAIKLHRSLVSHETGHSSQAAGILSPVLDILAWNSKGDAIVDYTLKELLYGGFWEHQRTSATSPPLPGNTKSHVFTITFVLQPTSVSFSNFTQCVTHLQSLWPHLSAQQESVSVNHFYYEAEWTLVEFAPLLCLYFIVFLYITFSVGKIDLVKSKWGLGFTAVVTVLASLSMSLGICTLFGLSLSVNGSEIYPYAFVLLGLENILIVVKAVMSTPAELGHVKYRIAAGLFKEGKAITMNLITQVVMFTSGIITFNYTMKEFCVMALVGVMCDFFLQVVFFPTVLSIDMRRLELIDLRSSSVSIPSSADTMEGIAQAVPPSPKSPNPRRLQLFYFLAKAKFLQRALIVAFIASIAHWCYNSTSFQAIVGTLSPSPYQPDKAVSVPTNELNIPTGSPYSSLVDSSSYGASPSNKQEFAYLKDQLSLEEKPFVYRRSIDGLAMECGGNFCWRPMVTDHWPKLLRHYGYPVKSRFISLLQPINLSLQLGFSIPQPEHHSTDDSFYRYVVLRLQWPYLARALFTVAAVGFIGAYFILLSVSTWNRRARSQKRVEKRLVHSKPCALKGHQQEVECLAVSNGVLYSASLDGSVRVWNPNPLTKKCLLTIDRSKILVQCPKTFNENKDLTESNQQVPNEITRNPSDPTNAVSSQDGSHGSRTARSLSLGALYDTPNMSGSAISRGQISPPVATPTSCFWTASAKPVVQRVRKVSSPLMTQPLPEPQIVQPQTQNSMLLYSSGATNFTMGTTSGPQSILTAAAAAIGLPSPVPVSPLRSFVAPETPVPSSPIGYDFERHFNLFSPYTSNLALEYSTESQIFNDEATAPAVWCMDVWNNTIAVGCGCGQIELWNGCTGVCVSCVNFNASGATVIAINQYGVLSCHMDGKLHLISHEGKLLQSVQAHSRPIGVMKCVADKVITGGYDTLVQAHHVLSLSPLFSVHLHNGSISSLCVDHHSNDGCLSGCTSGLVCYWELSTGNCLYEFENSGAAVLKLDALDGYFVGLFSDECIRTWDRQQGELMYKIQLDGLCQGFAATGVAHIAASVESHIVIYDVGSGKECGCQELDLQGKGAMLIRNITALDSGSIVFSAGCDLHIVPCVKIKND